MKRVVQRSRLGLLVGIPTMLILLWASVPTAQPQVPRAGLPDFLQPGHCFRLTFAVSGAPNWKVLDRLDHGWIKGEIDAGSARSEREVVWINTTQIITAREARCSS